MREKQVEQALVKAVKARGGICPKFVSPGLSGVPDRLVLMPNGQMGFVEIKAPTKWNGNSFFDKFYKVQNFFPYAIPIVLDNEPPRM